jgi:hypothetical protein
MAGRGWPIEEARAMLMARGRTLGLSPVEVADLPRQIDNAYKVPRTPSACRAEEAAPPQDEPKRRAMSLGKLLTSFPEMRPPLVEGLLRRSEVLNCIAPPKVGKSWLVNSLGIAHAMGQAWLGFGMHRGKVMIVDNELHPETSATRLRASASAMRVPVDALEGSLEILNLRGHLRDFNAFEETVLEQVEGRDFSMVILDAFYRFLPKDVDENSNGAMANIYNQLDKWAERLGVAFVLVHHTSKADQSGKEVVSVGAGAGSMSRAADTHLILRHHRLEHHVVVDAAVRSWPKIEPRVLRFDYPLWYQTNEDPTELRSDNGRKPDGWTPERFAEECVTLGGCDGNHIAAKADEFGLSPHRVRTLRAAALGRGLIRKSGGTRDAVWHRTAEMEAR